jgi:hypothetical protein
MEYFWTPVRPLGVSKESCLCHFRAFILDADVFGALELEAPASLSHMVVAQGSAQVNEFSGLSPEVRGFSGALGIGR